MENLNEIIESLASKMPAITLSEMSSIRLMNRTDQKYVTNVPTLIELLKLAHGNYYSQEVEGHRISPYATTYWDDAVTHSMFRQHETGRRPRQKVRVRTYVSSKVSFLEVKKKDNHGKTFKQRIQVPSLEAVINEHIGEDFLTEKTGLHFSEIDPMVGNRFNRITLVNFGKTERLTIDFDLHFYNYKTQECTEMDNIAIIELKRDGRTASPILPLLRQLRIKPAGFSKYCVGATVTDADLHVNRFKKRLVRIGKVVNRRALTDDKQATC